MRKVRSEQGSRVLLSDLACAFAALLPGFGYFGLLLMGPAVATWRFFDTLNKIERKMNEDL